MIAVYNNRRGRRRFAAKLARELGLLVRTPPDAGPGDLLINWGSSRRPDNEGVRWLLNTPEAVNRMANKIFCFRALSAFDVPTVRWTTSQDYAQQWYDEPDAPVIYERHRIAGHSGAGIRLACAAREETRGLTTAPLYTRSVPYDFHEFRVHIVDGTVVATQHKKRMGAAAIAEHGLVLPDDWTRNLIRTYRNGWVFTVTDVLLPVRAEEVAIAAMQAVSGLSGCVDLAVNKRDEDEVHVIEINSAPALRSPTVLSGYVEAIRGILANGRVANG